MKKYFFNYEFRTSIKYIFSFFKSKYLKGRVFFKNERLFNGHLENSYLITSEKGVFLMKNSSIKKLYSSHTFGISYDETSIFLACSDELKTYILKFDKKNFLNSKPDGKILFSQYISEPGSRIHQISQSNNSLWISCTFDNTIMEIDKSNGKVLKKLAPFDDEFGVPILVDQNHINSIFCSGKSILFVAYKVNNSSMILSMDDDIIKGYSYSNIGVHDISLNRETIYFCDTFGKNNLIDKGGSVIENGSIMNPEIFSKSPGFILRGFAKCGSEIVVGHSHKGIRSERLRGKAKIIHILNRKLKKIIEMPFAQVYDITCIDAKTIDSKSKELSFEEINNILYQSLGSPVYQKKVSDCKVQL